jgi:hypothetical protein
MEPILTDTLRFRLARVIAQRIEFKVQRDELARAIDAHREQHPANADEADSELWDVYRDVMGVEPGIAPPMADAS